MATDSAKNADVPKEQSIPDNKTTPEAAEHSSTEVDKNKTDMTNNVKKDDKTGDVKKNRRKVGMSITTSSPTPRRKNPSPRTLISVSRHVPTYETLLTITRGCSHYHETSIQGPRVHG